MYFVLLSIVAVRLILSQIDFNNSWIVGSPNYTLSEYFVVGYDISNHSIILLTGLYGSKGIISYNIAENDFREISSDNISFYWWGDAGTQIQNTLYFTGRVLPSDNAKTLCSLTMDTKNYTCLKKMPYNARYGVCLTHFDDNYLIGCGGFEFYRHFKTAIYSISEDTYLENFPRMQSRRYAHSCIVYGNYIYQFGGDIGGTIEKLYIDNNTINNHFTNSSWEYINHTLSPDEHYLIGKYSRAVIYDDKILIFHGKFIDILDPITDEITTVTPLVYGANGPAVIAVDEKIYYFGGDEHENEWQYVSYSIETTTTTPTTSIVRNCDCIGGMVELTVEYIGECDDANITMYYDIKKRLDEILPNCVFYNVIPGDFVRCTVDNGKFKNTLYFDIDCVNYRRRLKKKSSQENKQSKESKSKESKSKESKSKESKSKESKSKESKSKERQKSSSSDEHDKYCTAKLDTSCNSDIIGKQSKWCGDLKVISYVSGDGSICDETVNNEPAVINDERTESNDLLKNQPGSSMVITIFIIVMLLIAFLIIASYGIYIISQKKIKSNNRDVVMQETTNNETEICKIKTVSATDEHFTKNETSEENNLVTQIR